MNCFVGKYVVFYINFILSILLYLRLFSGVDYLEGLFEVYYDGIWGIVCDDGWDFVEMNVVCRELYFGKVDISVLLGYIFKGIGKMWLDDIFCVGNEKFLLDCCYCLWG